MAFQWYPVPSFGGGLNLGADPLALQDDQWTWCHAFFPENDQAQTAGAFGALCAGSTWGIDANHIPIGWVPDLVQIDQPAGILVFSTDPSQSNIYVSQIFFVWDSGSVVPTVGAITMAGTGQLAPDWQNPFMPPPMTTSVVAGQQLIVFGIPFDSARSGAAKYVADGKLYVLNGLRARHGCSSAGHGITATVGTDATNLRTVKISDAGAIDNWTPSPTGNTSADYFTVDGGDRITGLVTISGGFVVLTQKGLQICQSTRQIPAFTLDAMQSRGAIGQGALTSTGVVYMSHAGLCNASGQLVGAQVSDYLAWNKAPHVINDPVHDAAVVTNGSKVFPSSAATNVGEIIAVNLRTERAWRQMLPFPLYGSSLSPSTPPCVAHGTVTMQTLAQDRGPVGPAALPPPERVMHLVMDLTTGTIWGQYGDANPELNAFVDSKDFAFGSGGQPVNNTVGAMVSYVDRIKVSWESTATGALDVWVAVRNHLGRQAGAALPWQENTAQTLNWTKVGTLTAGRSELPLRLKGKFYRFRFAVSNGQPIRIRSFAIRYLPTADLRAAA